MGTSLRIIGNFQANNYARIIGKDQLGCMCRVPFVVRLIVLEALPCLCIYLMMDGHKHHAVVVEHMMILLAVLTLWCSLLTGSKKTVKFAPGICGSMSQLPCAYIIFVYTVTFF